MSILTQFRNRIASLEAKANRISSEVLITDRDFTRLRLEVISRQLLDAKISYWNLVAKS